MTSFARARGRPPTLVAIGVTGAGIASVAAVARTTGLLDPRHGSSVVGLAIAATVACLIGWYRVAAASLPGRRAAKAGAAFGAAAGVLALIGGAAHDGTFDLGAFGTAFLNADVLAGSLPVLLGGVWNTLRLAVVAEILALVLGITISSLAISGSRLGRAVAISYVDVVRGLPILVLTALIYGGLPYLGVVLQPFLGAVVILGMNSGAYSAEIFRAGIQSVPRGQAEAARSLGMPYAQMMGWVVLPQAARNVVPPLVSDFIALLKDTAIVLSLIGFTFASADLFGRARGIVSSTFSPTPYVLAALFYLAMTMPLARLVGALEKRARTAYA